MGNCWGRGFARDADNELYSCNCQFGYKGIDCNIECEGGSDHPCNGKGTFDWATRRWDPFKDDKYDCEVDGMVFSWFSSLRLLRCESLVGSCTCRDGYQGRDCSTVCDPVPDNPVTGEVGKHYKVGITTPVNR